MIYVQLYLNLAAIICILKVFFLSLRWVNPVLATLFSPVLWSAGFTARRERRGGARDKESGESTSGWRNGNKMKKKLRQVHQTGTTDQWGHTNSWPRTQRDEKTSPVSFWSSQLWNFSDTVSNSSLEYYRIQNLFKFKQLPPNHNWPWGEAEYFYRNIKTQRNTPMMLHKNSSSSFLSRLYRSVVLLSNHHSEKRGSSKAI